MWTNKVVVKAFVYRILIIISAYAVLKALNHTTSTSITVAILNNFIATFTHSAFEYFTEKLTWARNTMWYAGKSLGYRVVGLGVGVFSLWIVTGNLFDASTYAIILNIICAIMYVIVDVAIDRLYSNQGERL